jgi:hypothetical protein
MLTHFHDFWALKLTHFVNFWAQKLLKWVSTVCVQKMMTAYGIQHRIISVGNPHTNSRAELGVMTVKRMLRDNVGADGSLDTAGISRALFQLCNTPDRDTKLFPANALFGRELRDFLPRPGTALMGSCG